MVNSDLLITAAILFSATFFTGAKALNCYICAEEGLDEFGECQKSFPFSCDGYAKRFPKGEQIFCRTTRHKAANGTFTVVKECIADSAHHVTFPRKPYQLAEECDVVDLNGVEVAYCLCGAENLCNGEPIVGQFSAFEEKYPELFDSEPTASSDQFSVSSHQRSSAEDGGGEFGEAANVRPAEEKQRERSEEEAAESAEQVAKGENNAEGMETESESRQMGGTSQGPMVDGSVHFGTTDQWESAGAETATTEEQHQNRNDGEMENNNGNPFVAPPKRNEENGDKITENIGEFGTIPTTAKTDDGTQRTTAPAEAAEGVKSTAADEMPDFKCYQCKETDLPNGADDCQTQTVANCAGLSKIVPAVGRLLCLSRQFVDTKNGLSRVEKGCATERSILNELGTKAVPMLNALINGGISCGQQGKSGERANAESEGAAENWQNICICTTAQCNGKSVGEQVLLANPQQMRRLPFPSPFSVSTQSYELTTKSVPKLSAEEHFLSTTSEPLNCAVCLDVELGNSLSDCRNAHSQNCAHQIRGEKAFCLTRQTQNGKDAFIVEKSCVTKRQFYQQFPEELEKHSADEVPIGCDATYNGFVNYCLCEGQMCNRNSLSEQAEKQGKNGKMSNKTKAQNDEKHRKNDAEKGQPLFVPSAADSTTMFSMKAPNPSAEMAARQDEMGAQSLGDDPSPPNWPNSALSWPTAAAPPTSVPTTIAQSTETQQNDRLKKWKQNSERAKRPFERDGDDESHGQRPNLSMGFGIVHALLTLFIYFLVI